MDRGGGREPRQRLAGHAAGVEDRPADVWEPLLAVADAAGGSWPTRARAACMQLVDVAASGEASLGVRLLGDLRVVFGNAGALHSETILDELHKLDEAPWADLRGKPLDPRGLARLLGNYQIRSVKVKVDGRALQGYRREHLHDAWTRYLTPLSESPEPPEPPELRRSEHSSKVPDAAEVSEPRPGAEPVTPLVTCTVPQVPHCRDAEPVCRAAMNPTLAAAGETTHPGCEPVEKLNAS